MLSVGVVGTSLKEHENRVPVHPDHLVNIHPQIRKNLFFESDYGKKFGVPNEKMESLSGGMLSRTGLFEECDIVLLPKPVPDDFQQLRNGGNVWGWIHFVQQPELTSLAIQKKLTAITWEGMNSWDAAGNWKMHIFNKNNELAGYSAVLDALRLKGWDGFYGPDRKVIVIGFGSVSRGAIYALSNRGIKDITVLTPDPPHTVSNKIPGTRYIQMKSVPDQFLIGIGEDGSEAPLIEIIGEADIIVNGILQDPENPLMFVAKEDTRKLKDRSLIIDVSCDQGMGFWFAVPTTFNQPMIEMGHFSYYAVDHTPSYLWDAASLEISKALIPFLGTVMNGRESWEENETIRKAVEIQDGHIRNPQILSFQKRSAEFPYPILDK